MKEQKEEEEEEEEEEERKGEGEAGKEDRNKRRKGKKKGGGRKRICRSSTPNARHIGMVMDRHSATTLLIPTAVMRPQCAASFLRREDFFDDAIETTMSPSTPASNIIWSPTCDPYSYGFRR